MNFHKIASKQQKDSLAECGSLCEEKSFCWYLSPFTGLIKNSCLNKSKFSSGFFPFKHGKRNKVSEFFSAHFWDRHFSD